MLWFCLISNNLKYLVLKVYTCQQEICLCGLFGHITKYVVIWYTYGMILFYGIYAYKCYLTLFFSWSNWFASSPHKGKKKFWNVILDFFWWCIFDNIDLCFVWKEIKIARKKKLLVSYYKKVKSKKFWKFLFLCAATCSG